MVRRRVRLLQVCNVGRITGGTAACAWTVTRALPDVEHEVAFLSDVSPETSRMFAHCRIHRWSAVSDAGVRKLAPDFVLLHNTDPAHCERIESAWTVQYVHSPGARAAADRTVFCSQWLAEQCLGPSASSEAVLIQAVTTPREPALKRRGSGESLVVGRLCTPKASKWPPEVIAFTAELAARHPPVEWEFVGCPSSMQPALMKACRGRATFHPAAWEARRRLWRWDALVYHNPHVTESFGRTAAEAMRAGCIPMVDARGGFCEQIRPGTGWLCSDLDGFSRALESLRDLSTRQETSRRAARHADREFSLSRFRRELLRVLRPRRC